MRIVVICIVAKRLRNLVFLLLFRFDDLLVVQQKQKRPHEGGGKREITGSCLDSPSAFHLALQIVLQAHLVDEFDLGFEEIDVLLGVVQDFLQQIA